MGRDIELLNINGPVLFGSRLLPNGLDMKAEDEHNSSEIWARLKKVWISFFFFETSLDFLKSDWIGVSEKSNVRCLNYFIFFFFSNKMINENMTNQFNSFIEDAAATTAIY